MMCTTPLDARRSVLVIWILLTKAPCSFRAMTTSAPSTVMIFSPSMRSSAKTFPAATWYVRMSARLGSSRSSAIVTPSILARASKALSVGPKTVNGPSPSRVSTS